MTSVRAVQLNGENAPGVGQLVQDMKKLSEDQDMADVSFLVGPDDDRITAHRLILSARYLSWSPTLM